ncbi:hypothetical protein [Pseudoalteromonas aliena]|jgi:hypothetical protein|uniref:hypothetical protein n=1 Tax=Pseudoalteromonas aliena TaxID=247523 RepID=UPI001868208E|nr:hypothetical protein [Pseudoalteromonas aliena]
MKLSLKKKNLKKLNTSLVRTLDNKDLKNVFGGYGEQGEAPVVTHSIKRPTTRP